MREKAVWDMKRYSFVVNGSEPSLVKSSKGLSTGMYSTFTGTTFRHVCESKVRKYYATVFVKKR